MGIFRNSILCEYNSVIGDMLVMNCGCYEIYRNEKRFIEEIIFQQNSYLGCIVKKEKNRVTHRSIPIMLGSKIDFTIRGEEKVKRDQVLWGAFILKGMPQIYSIFSTYDALSMHVVYTDNSYHIEFYTYVDKNGLGIEYRNGHVEWTFMKKKYDSRYNGEGWVDLLNQSNPYSSENVSAEQYRRLFNTMLNYPYDMNLLANRQFLSGTTAMKKYIDYHQEPRGKQKPSLANAFEMGIIYVALCKSNQYENVNWFKKYSQSYNNPLNEGRSDKVEHFLPTVSRVINRGLRNSKKALSFPDDAYGFFCPLNTKDMKSAGEQNVLTDETIISTVTFDSIVYDYFKRFNQNEGDHILLNDRFIHCRMVMDLNALIKLKQQFPHVTTRYYRPYILVTTKNSILLKYSHTHKVYFSPAEVTEFGIKMDERSILSLTAKLLHQESYRRNQAAKSTVAINNQKGSVAILSSNFHKALMQNTLGYSCYMEEIDHQRVLDSAVLERGCDTLDFHKLYDEYIRPNIDMPANNPLVTHANNAEPLSVNSLYDIGRLCFSHWDGPKFTRNDHDIENVYRYQHVVLGNDAYEPKPIRNLRLWCMFGNYKGSTIEDGIMLDKRAVDEINKNPIVYNAFLTVDFIFGNKMQTKNTHFIFVKRPKNSRGLINGNNETLIGCLITTNEARIRTSSHCKIKQGRIANHIYYLIHFLPSQSEMYDNLKVQKRLNGKYVTISMRGVHKANIIVGSKLTNDSGQKNICTKISDMSKFWGVTRDGRKVHAQIMYSEVSMIGRVPCGQIFNMLKSSDLALGPDGLFIAPIDLVIHTLHPYTNNKIFDIKVDTLTNVNGFDSQNMANVSFALRNTKKLKSIITDLFGFHGFQLDFKHDDLRII